MKTRLHTFLLTCSQQAIAYVTFCPAKHYGTADRFVRVGSIAWC